jgi:hypothetical protein
MVLRTRTCFVFGICTGTRGFDAANDVLESHQAPTEGVADPTKRAQDDCYSVSDPDRSHMVEGSQHLKKGLVIEHKNWRLLLPN